MYVQVTAPAFVASLCRRLPPFFFKRWPKVCPLRNISFSSSPPPLPQQQLYAPPQPVVEAGAENDIVLDSAQLAQYHVGFMHFQPFLPDLTRRRKRRKKVRDMQRRGKPLSTRLVARNGRLHISEAARAELRQRHELCQSRKQQRQQQAQQSLASGAIPPTEALPVISRGVLASIFRKREDAKAAKLNRAPKHPRRPAPKTSTGGAAAQSVATDSNKDAPMWQIEEDWALLRAVKVYLSQTGSINWHLVANVVNISGTFTGGLGMRAEGLLERAMALPMPTSFTGWPHSRFISLCVSPPPTFHRLVPQAAFARGSSVATATLTSSCPAKRAAPSVREAPRPAATRSPRRKRPRRNRRQPRPTPAPNSRRRRR